MKLDDLRQGVGTLWDSVTEGWETAAPRGGRGADALPAGAQGQPARAG